MKFRKCHVPNGTVHSGCIHPTRTTARLVIVLVSRIQKSGTGDNNFVKWKGPFYPGCQRRFMRGFRFRKRPTKRRSLARKNLWYPGWGHFGPADQNDQMYVPTEVSRILGWMESAPDVLLHLALSWLKILETPMHFPLLLHRITLQMRRGIFQSVSRFLSEIVDSTLWTFYWPVFHRLRSKVFKSEVWTCALCFFR